MSKGMTIYVAVCLILALIVLIWDHMVGASDIGAFSQSQNRKMDFVTGEN